MPTPPDTNFWPVTPTIAASILPGVTSHAVRLTLGPVQTGRTGLVERVVSDYNGQATLYLASPPPDTFLVDEVIRLYGFFAQNGVTTVANERYVQVKSVPSPSQIVVDYRPGNANSAPQLVTQNFVGTGNLPSIEHYPYPQAMKVEVQKDGGDWTLLYHAGFRSTIDHQFLQHGVYKYRVTLGTPYIGTTWLLFTNWAEIRYLTSSVIESNEVTITQPTNSPYTAVVDLSASVIADELTLSWTHPAGKPAIRTTIERSYDGADWSVAVSSVDLRPPYIDATADLSRTVHYRLRYLSYTPIINGLYYPYGIGITGYPPSEDPLDANADGVVDVADMRHIVADRLATARAAAPFTGPYPTYGLSEYDYSDVADNNASQCAALGRKTASVPIPYGTDAVLKTQLNYLSRFAVDHIEARSDWSPIATVEAAEFFQYAVWAVDNLLLIMQPNMLARQTIVVDEHPIFSIDVYGPSAEIYYLAQSATEHFLRRTNAQGLTVANYASLADAPGRGLSLNLLPGPRAIWANENKLLTAAEADTWVVSELVDFGSNILAVRYNTQNELLYIVDAAGKLSTCTTSGPLPVIMELADLSGSLGSCSDLSFDYVAEKLLLSDPQTGTVWRCNWDGTAGAAYLSDRVENLGCDVHSGRDEVWLGEFTAGGYCISVLSLTTGLLLARRGSLGRVTACRFHYAGPSRPAAPVLTVNRSGADNLLVWTSTATHSGFEVYASADNWETETLLAFLADLNFTHAGAAADTKYRVRSVAVSPLPGSGDWTNPRHSLDVLDDGWVNGLDVMAVINWLLVLNEGGTPSPLGPPTEYSLGDPYLDVDGSLSVQPADASAIMAYLAELPSEFSDSEAYVEATTVATATEVYTCPDFAWWGSGGQFSTTDLWLGASDLPPSGGQYSHATLRFAVDIPPGSTIEAASLRFVAGTSQGGGNIALTIAAENNANAAAITDFAAAAASAAASLPTTVPWTALPNWLAGGSYSSPDIAAIVQAYIDLPGYVAGSHLVLHVLDNNPTAGPQPRHVRVLSPCVGSVNPRLLVDYTPPEPTTEEETTAEETTPESTTAEPVEVDCRHVRMVGGEFGVFIDVVDGSTLRVVLPTDSASPAFVADSAFDADTQDIYYAVAQEFSVGNTTVGGSAPQGGYIYKLSDLDSGSKTTIYAQPGINESVVSLWLDVVNSHLYFLKHTPLSGGPSEILRCDLDGSNVTTIVPAATLAKAANFMFVDFDNGHIYVPTKVSGNEALSRFDLDGNNRLNIATGLGVSVACPFVSLTNSKIYFSTDSYPPSIYRLPLAGGPLWQIYNSAGAVPAPYGIAVDIQAGIIYCRSRYSGDVYRAVLQDHIGSDDFEQILNWQASYSEPYSRGHSLRLCGTEYGLPTTEPEEPTTAEPTTAVGGEGGYYLSWIDRYPCDIPGSDPLQTGYRIRRTNRDAGWIDTAYHDQFNGLGLIVSEKFGRYYWTDSLLGAVYSVSLDGTDLRVELTGLTQPQGLALDETNDRLYVVDLGTQSLALAALGVDAFTTIVAGLRSPLDVALDVGNNAVYLTAGDRVLRTTLAGGSTVTVVSFNDVNVALYGLDIDRGAGVLYTVRLGAGEISSLGGAIYSVATDGSNLTRLVGNIHVPIKCVVDPVAGHLFWTEPLQGTIRRANTDGTDIIKFVHEPGHFYSWLALLQVPDVTTTEEPTTEEPPPPTTEEPTTEEPTTEEPTTEEPTTREADVLGELSQICVDQPQGGTVYPFVWPSDDLGLLIGDLYLVFQPANFRPPFSVKRLQNFNQNATSRYEVLIVDADDAVIFDTEASVPALFKQYSWSNTKRVLEYVDAQEQVLRVVVYTVQETARAWPAIIEPTDGRIDPRCLCALPPHLTRLAVKLENGSVQDLPAETNLVFSGGYNVELATVVTAAAGGDAGGDIELSVVPGAGLGRYPGCDETVFVQMINKVSPDSRGNIALKFAGPGLNEAHCYRLERPTAAVDIVEGGFDALAIEPNTIKLVNNCEPCCKCEDFVKVYQAIRRLYNKYKRLGRRAEAVRDQLKRNIDRWRANSECRRTMSLRVAVVPLAACRVGVGAGLCNNSAEKVSNITLKLEFSGEAPAGCVRCSSVLRSGNVDPTSTAPPSRQVPYKLRGAWPTFYADFDCINSGTLGSVVFQLEFTGQTGQELTLTVSVDGNNPTDAAAVSETAIINCEQDPEGCCEAAEVTTETAETVLLPITTVTGFEAAGSVIINLAEPLPRALPVGRSVTIISTATNALNGAHSVSIAAAAGSREVVVSSIWTANSTGGYLEI